MIIYDDDALFASFGSSTFIYQCAHVNAEWFSFSISLYFGSLICEWGSVCVCVCAYVKIVFVNVYSSIGNMAISLIKNLN